MAVNVAAGVIYSDMIFNGTVTFAKAPNFNVPSINDAAVIASANINASKLMHQYESHYSQGNVTPVAEQKVVHIVRGATGTILGLKAGMPVKNTTGSVTVDLLKNGTSILTSTITLDNTITNYVPVAAAGFTSTAVVANDVLEVKVTISAPTGTGVFAQLDMTETAA